VEVNRILAPVTALGPGRRLGLWVQGCSLRCPGCASRDTWAPGEGTRIGVEQLAQELAARIKADSLTGLTITGGEPLDQAEALAGVVSRLRSLMSPERPEPTGPPAPGGVSFGDRQEPEPRELDVLLFTGYAASSPSSPRDQARRRAGALWDLLDAVVAGPYRRDLPSDQPLVASSNQRLIVLTPGWTPGPGGSMQVMVADGELTMVGLPRPGDLDRLEAHLCERGVYLGGASWRS
jgi:anaerobic ribonucleoside-triphosphate reductase activating protein